MRPVPERWLALGVCLGVLALPAHVVAAEATDSSARLEQRVRRLENIVDSGQIARLIQRLNSLEGEIRELRGQIETQEHRLGELRERQRSLYGDLDRRLRELEIAATRPEPADDAGDGGGDEGGDGDGGAQGEDAGEGQGGDAAPSAAESGSAAAGEPAPEGDSGEDEDDGGGSASAEEQRDAYDAAFSLLREGRYDDAAEAFSRFIENHPRGSYADNAQYWLGEAHYVTRDFEAALAAFRKTVEEYPDSAKVPDARLKIGYTLDELDRPEDARAALQQVVSEHPNSTVSRLAEERLLDLENRSEEEGD